MWNRLWKRLINERGQIALPNLGTNLIPSLSSYLTGLTNNTTATGLPRTAEQLGGLGLLAYSMRPQEDITVPSIYDYRSPYGTSSVNYLQGLYQSPSDPFAAGGIYEKYLPALQQSETDAYNNAQQALIAGLPQSASTAMGGSEIAAIRNAFLTRALPQRLALQGDLMRDAIARQQNAANTVYGGESNLQQTAFAGDVEAAKANALTQSTRNQYLAQLGAALLLANRTGGAATGMPGTGSTAPGSIAQALQKYLGGGISIPGGEALSNIFGLSGTGANAEAAAAISGKLQGLFPGTAIGGYSDLGNGAIGILGEDGSVIGSVGPQGQVINQATGQVLSGSVAGGSSLMSTLLPIVQAAGGLFLTSQASNLGQNQFQSGAIGAAGGALAGSAFGPIGTAVGAVAGGLWGLFSEHQDQVAQKEAFRQSDLASQTDQVQELRYAGQQIAQQLGIPAGAIQTFLQNAPINADTPADEQMQIAQSLNTLIHTYVPAAQWTQVEPQVRQFFIDYLTRNTTTAPNSAGGGSSYLPLITSWANTAGLAQGGTLPAGGEFIVGERGPELLRASPGSQVLPMFRQPDGSYAFDRLAAARQVAPNQPFIPDISRAFEGLPRQATPFVLPPGQALTAALASQPNAPGSVPAMIASLRAQGTFPGQGATSPIARQPVLPPAAPQSRPSYTGRPMFAGSRPTGARGQSTLATALQQTRSRRKKNAYA